MLLFYFNFFLFVCFLFQVQFNASYKHQIIGCSQIYVRFASGVITQISDIWWLFLFIYFILHLSIYFILFYFILFIIYYLSIFLFSIYLLLLCSKCWFPLAIEKLHLRNRQCRFCNVAVGMLLFFACFLIDESGNIGERIGDDRAIGVTMKIIYLCMVASPFSFWPVLFSLNVFVSDNISSPWTMNQSVSWYTVASHHKPNKSVLKVFFWSKLFLRSLSKCVFNTFLSQDRSKLYLSQICSLEIL